MCAVGRVGLRGPVLRGVRRARRRVPPRLPGLGRGGRGLAPPQETAQKEHGRGSRH